MNVPQVVSRLRERAGGRGKKGHRRQKGIEARGRT